VMSYRLPILRKRTAPVGDAGQAMVEFALVAVFIVFLFIAMIQVVLLMHSYNTLADAAKEGVRYAIVHGSSNSNCSSPTASAACATPDPTPFANVQTRVVNFAAASVQNVTTSDVTVTYFSKDNTATACGDPGCMVRVEVHHTYAPLFGLGWPHVTLNAAAEGRIMN
jgi:Flp pilus assembly protein TadG